MLLLVILPAVISASLEPKTISVSLVADWQRPSIISEATEVIGAVSATSYWQFLDAIAESKLPRNTDREQLTLTEEALKAVDNLGTSVYSILNYSISIDNFAPKIEMLRQLSKSHVHEIGSRFSESDSIHACADALFVFGDSGWACGLGDFKTKFSKFAALDEPQDSSSGAFSRVFEFDRVSFGSDVNATKVILYSDIASKSFQEAHTYLREMSQRSEIAYILRPVAVNSPDKEAGDTMPLQGFGVELAIKSQEYKVLDDAIPDPDAEDGSLSELLEGDGDSHEHEIEGFYFEKLKDRHPELSEKLESFRKDLLSRSNEDAKVDVWDIQDIGVQTIARILRAKDPLATFVRISQNFPMFASGLTKLSVNQTLKADVASLQKQLQFEGLRINSETFASIPDIYNLHDSLLRQSASADGLLSLGLAPRAVRELMSIKRKPSTDQGHQRMSEIPFQLDVEVGNDALVWLNDLESGAYPYNQWAPTVQEFLAPAWPNQMRYIAKNLHRLVVVLDPTTLTGLEMMVQARSFVQANAPITVGLVFDLRDSQESAEEDDAAADSAPDSTPKCLPTSSWAKSLDDMPWASAMRSKCTASISEDAADDVDSSVPLKEAIARLFHALAFHDEYGPTAAWEFLASVAEKATNAKPKGRVTRAKLKKAFKATAEKAGMKPMIDEIFEERTTVGKSPEECNAWIAEVRRWNMRKGLPKQEYSMLLNGVLLPKVPSQSFRRVAMTGVLMGQMMYQHAVYEGKLTDETSIDEFVRSKPGTFPRLSSTILEPAEKIKFIDSLQFPPSIRYLPPPPQVKESIPSVTHWIVADLGTPTGRMLASGALEFWENAAAEAPTITSRVAILHNPAAESSSSGTKHPLLLQALSTKLDSPKDLAILGALLRTVFDETLLEEALGITLGESQVSAESYLGLSCGSYCAQALGITPGENAIVTNGRVVKLSDAVSGPGIQFASEEFAEDLRLSETFLSDYLSLEQIVEILSKYDTMPADHGSQGATGVPSHTQSDRILTVSYRLGQISSSGGGEDIEFPDPSKFSNVFRFPNDEAVISVTAIIDPLTEDAQRASPVLLMLRDVLNVDLTIFLSPSLEISEIPLKRFYRSAVGGKFGEEGQVQDNGYIQFDDQGRRQLSSGVVFSSIRTRALLTMNVEATEGWLVASRRAPYDLDNILLDDLSARTNVQYGIDNALLQGQCIDMDEREPPAGLQLELGNSSEPHVQDTLVMFNLGYFQLKAAPGVWKMRIAPNRHGEIYRIDEAHVAGGNTSADEFGLMPIYKFRSKPQLLQVRRRPGMQHVKLLEEIENGPKSKGEEKKDGNILGTITNLFNSENGGGDGNKGSTESTGQTDDDETVHVFSLASGLLYERFLKIMMQSVVSSTKSKVKFWFLSNFLSPQFKTFVPKMAEELGFEVELVTYQWPKWLRQQTVKQRIIWGYKILFLDVLFPLSLKRIIYIDADQVVRGDVRELWDMDLKGAPYGYTPFCSSNTATNGFRFWDSGYWKSHLQGKPYHISALYVVDLNRFRRMRAGDTLRSVYDNLSQDPNSLANLDQDLPNYTQHTVPIFSLPQQWLWCETWCSMETLPTAKTIDLCNNPLTKKPKLDVARELLPEWTVYDERQRSITQRLMDEA